MVWGSLIWYFILDYFYNFVVGGSYVGSLTMVRIIPIRLYVYEKHRSYPNDS